ncbi:hypothetical protein [Pseudoalteromonas sp. DY56-GL79]|uniref:hypothetical protein n=1 Tax=Pseudoalteromonas sp. DY56-GL79 TaxID=2967131 RepID=UPI00352A933B
MGLEALIMPYFLPKQTYGEVEFYKFSAFFAQFLLIGAGTGYVVRFMEKYDAYMAKFKLDFISLGLVHALASGLLISAFYDWQAGLLAMLAVFALVIESIMKANEDYLAAMSFKPLLSVILLALLPAFFYFEISVYSYLIISFLASFIIFTTCFALLNKDIKGNTLATSSLDSYISCIKKGFLMHLSTAVIYAFFYFDRLFLKENSPELLADYSLSFAIMQLTIVAITTFSYVNLVEFGKSSNDLDEMAKKIRLSLMRCFAFYMVIGSVSIIFSYFAEIFYGYEHVFETTFIMVALFGLANVLNSLNSAHAYLKSNRIMFVLLALFFCISFSSNYWFNFEGTAGYYNLMLKTYLCFLGFSISSSMYIFYRLKSK